MSRAPEVETKALFEHLLATRPSEIDARMKVLGASAGRPWRKEQKLACLAAWTRIHAM